MQEGQGQTQTYEDLGGESNPYSVEKKNDVSINGDGTDTPITYPKVEKPTDETLPLVSQEEKPSKLSWFAQKAKAAVPAVVFGLASGVSAAASKLGKAAVWGASYDKGCEEAVEAFTNRGNYPCPAYPNDLISDQNAPTPNWVDTALLGSSAFLCVAASYEFAKRAGKAIAEGEYGRAARWGAASGVGVVTAITCVFAGTDTESKKLEQSAEYNGCVDGWTGMQESYVKNPTNPQYTCESPGLGNPTLNTGVSEQIIYLAVGAGVAVGTAAVGAVKGYREQKQEEFHQANRGGMNPELNNVPSAPSNNENRCCL